jgi:hypothetical protein
MPDISMCQNTTCPSRMKCYRYRAKPNGDRQSWAAFAPADGDPICNAFMEVWESTAHHLVPEGDLK